MSLLEASNSLKNFTSKNFVKAPRTTPHPPPGVSASSGDPLLRNPIYSLPDEILANIIEVGRASPSPVPMPHIGPVFEILVSQVTQRWRNVAIHTRHIRSRITISSAKCAELVAVYLQESGVVPLDLFIDFKPRYFGFEVTSAMLRIYEYSSSIYILNIISSLSFTYTHTGYIPISDHLHIGRRVSNVSSSC
jgi:hypothetical protein